MWRSDNLSFVYPGLFENGVGPHHQIFHIQFQFLICKMNLDIFNRTGTRSLNSSLGVLQVSSRRERTTVRQLDLLRWKQISSYFYFYCRSYPGHIVKILFLLISRLLIRPSDGCLQNETFYLQKSYLKSTKFVLYYLILMYSTCHFIFYSLQFVSSLFTWAWFWYDPNFKNNLRQVSS